MKGIPELGIGLWWLWFLSYFFIDIDLAAINGSVSINISAALKIMTMTGYVVVALASLVPRVSALYRDGTPLVLAICCIIQVFTCAFMAAADLTTLVGMAVTLVSTFIASLGAGIYLLLWVSLFARRGTVDALKLLSVGLVIGGVLWFAMGLLAAHSFSLYWLIVGISPVLEVVCYVVSKGDITKDNNNPNNINHIDKSINKTEKTVRPTPIFTSFGVVYGLLFGFMDAFAPAAFNGADASVSVPAAATFGLTVAGVAMTAYSIRHAGSNIDYAHALRPPLLILACGYGLLPIYGTDGLLAVQALIALGYLMFWLLYNSVWIEISIRGETSVYATSSWGFAISALPIALGAGIGVAIAHLSLVGDQIADLHTCAIIGVCALLFILIAYMFLMDSSIFVNLGGMVSIQERVHQDDAITVGVDILSKKYGLTMREREIALMMARGRNARYMEEKLGVSVATIRTHMHHVYEKCNVHSGQEFIDLVEKSGKNQAN